MTNTSQDIAGLIERLLRQANPDDCISSLLSWQNGPQKDLKEAAAALRSQQAENEQLREELDDFQARAAGISIMEAEDTP